MKKLLLLLAIAAFCMPTWSADTKNLKYVDGTTLTIINKPQHDGNRLRRINTDKYPDLTSRVRHYLNMPTGMALRFRTNSPVIRAKWTTLDTLRHTNMASISEKGLDLYIKQDGKWLWAGFGNPKFEGTKHASTMINDMDTTMKECMLYLPTFMQVNSIEIGVAPDSRIESCGDIKRAPVVAMGSSYTHGSGTSRAGMAWPAQLSRMLGVDIANYGTSGQQKMEQFFADIICDTDADMFIFDCFSNPSPKEIHERFAPFVKKIRSKHPTTPLVFLETVDRECKNFDLKKRKFENDKEQAAREEIAKVIANDPNIYFFEPGLYTGTDHETSVDGTHPGDMGYQRAAINIAEKINATPALKKIIDAAKAKDCCKSPGKCPASKK